jgi:putative effector of murein hydrolase LrgA (UPF0299 family)
MRFLFPVVIGLVLGFVAATLRLDFFSMVIACTAATVLAALAAGYRARVVR